jgi:chromosome segregation ATPase
MLTEERDKMVHDLKISKRATSKAEKDLREQEELKIQQDLLVDGLNQQIDRLQTELNLYETRLERHRHEDDGVKELLADAQNEIEVIIVEKKRLLSQWKSALSALSRNDEATIKVQKDIANIKDMAKSFEVKIDGLKKGIAELEEKKEVNSEIAANLDQKSSKIAEQLEDILLNKKALTETLETLTKSADVANKDYEVISQKCRLAQIEIESTSQRIRDIASEIQVIEMDAMKLLISRAAEDRYGSSRSRDGVKLRKMSQEIEMVIAQVRNEAARNQLLVLDHNRTNNDLKLTLNDLEKEVAKEAQIIQKFETEINQREIEYKKCQRELNILNKKYARIVESIQAQTGAIDGEMGPLEATIHSLTQSITQMENELIDLQQIWIRTQNELVICTKNLDDIQQILMQSRTRKSVFERKVASIDRDIKREEEESRELRKSCSSLRSQMERLNAALEKNRKSHKQINDSTKETELAFKQQLRESEKECLQLSDKVEKIKNEAEKASEDLVEARYIEFLL